ncbi:MAG: hypothetical protein OEW49_05590 [Nitrosopumilus sp.]|nr:hypothetical protein [Nitrosopumilus sp.]
MSEDHVLRWSKDFFLKWSNFEAESNPAAFEDAHSTIKYRFTWTVSSEEINDQIMFQIEDIRVFVEFHSLLSWVRYSQSSDNLLKHEQGVFDLAELIKRENLNALQNIFHGKQFPTRGKNEQQQKQFAKEDSGKMIAHEVEKLEDIYKKKCQEYVDQTNFGQDQEKQSEYNLMFEKLRE